MNAKISMLIKHLKYYPVFIHSVVGFAAGYFLLHPITMVIYWFEVNDNSLSLQSITAAFNKAFMQAFYFNMMPMALAFIIIGGIIGLFSGLSFMKIRKQGYEIRMKQHQLNENLKELENLNKNLEKKIDERTIQLKESNENLEILNLKLLDLDKAKAEFMRLISHEIRTPLNGIIGPLELLKERVYTKEIGSLVEILDTSVKRLEKFALNTLLITNLKTRLLEPKKERIYLSSLISEIIAEENAIIQSRNIQVIIHDGVTSGLILGETDLIKKSLGNILENALLFSPQNSIVVINTFAEDQNVICEIKDNGNGFKEGYIDNTFEIFTSKGMGLPIAKMIMVAHGGDIIIRNNPEGGASIKLLFMKSFEDRT